jgi:hypothetical protein
MEVAWKLIGFPMAAHLLVSLGQLLLFVTAKFLQ